MRKKAAMPLASAVLTGVLSHVLGSVGAVEAQRAVERQKVRAAQQKAFQILMEHPDLQEIPERERAEIINTYVRIAPKLSRTAPHIIVRAVKHTYHYGAYSPDVVKEIRQSETAIGNYL